MKGKEETGGKGMKGKERKGGNRRKGKEGRKGEKILIFISLFSSLDSSGGAS